MSDTYTNPVSSAEPRSAAATGYPNTKDPLSDLFANVLDKTAFAEQMFSESEFGLARDAERDYEPRPEPDDSDYERPEAKPTDDRTRESRDADERSRDDDEAQAENQAEDTPQEDGQADPKQTNVTVAENSVLTIGASAQKTQATNNMDGKSQQTSQSAQTNMAGNAVQDSKVADPNQGKVQTAAATGESKTANQNIETANIAKAAAQDTTAQGTSQNKDASAKLATDANAAADPRTQANQRQSQTQTQVDAQGDGKNLGAELDKHAELIRTGAKRAAELHNMKTRVLAHRDAIKKAVAQSASNSSEVQSQNNRTTANKPAVEVTTTISPTAPANPEAAATRPATPPTAPTLAGTPGQTTPTSSSTMVIGDSTANGVDQSASAADKQSTTSSFTRALGARPPMTQPGYQPAEQVKVHIQQLVNSGADRIQVKLSPASLGQVEVALEVSPDKTVQAVVYADKPETLDMLERDSKILQQVFEDAGMELDSDGLTFKHGQSGNPDPELAEGSSKAAGDGAEDADGSDADSAAETDQPSRRQHDGMLDLEI